MTDPVRKISVIVAAYNAERYIAEAIDSVLAQDYPEVECVVVDDGSRDSTAEIVRGYGPRVRYLFQENAERSAARNNGIAHASGEYLCFLDADDLIAPQKLSEQAAVLDRDPGCDVVYSRVAYFQEGEGTATVPSRKTPSGDILSELVYGNFITIHSPLIRRGAIARIGGFDPSRNRYEDWDFFLRLSLTGARFAFLDRLHAKVRLHGENTVRDRARMFEAKLQVAQQVAAAYPRELAGHSLDPAALVAFHQADYGRILILAGKSEEGRALIAQACRNRFPHRSIFALFSLAAGVFGAPLLVAAQEVYDRLVKGRRAGKGGTPA